MIKGQVPFDRHVLYTQQQLKGKVGIVPERQTTNVLFQGPLCRLIGGVGAGVYHHNCSFHLVNKAYYFKKETRETAYLTVKTRLCIRSPQTSAAANRQGTGPNPSGPSHGSRRSAAPHGEGEDLHRPGARGTAPRRRLPVGAGGRPRSSAPRSHVRNLPSPETHLSTNPIKIFR